MKIHREGNRTILITTILFLLVNAASYRWLCCHPLLPWGIFILTLALLLFILSFFRVPDRILTQDEGLIVAPADGKVVVIEEMTDTEYFNQKRLQVSIFMSPANVHLNRCPISGEVTYSKYHPGKYLVAWNPKSSTENERHSVVIRKGGTEILVKQIAGALARRIVNYLQAGEQVRQNQELGFIKFGSRVDLLLPPGTRVDVQLNQAVKGGVTVIARI
jgi:phosphatidylserine decarboxylase